MTKKYIILCTNLLGILLLTSFGFAQDEPETTKITIDGNPSDWEGLEILQTDAQGDHQGGGFDIAAVRAFANDQFFYLLIETYGLRQDYVQLDLEIRAGERLFVVSFNPEMGSAANMGEVTTGDWQEIGQVAGSLSAGGEAAEFKMPLAAFGETSQITLMGVRPMAGECCDADWQPVDEIDPVDVPFLDELEPEHQEQVQQPPKEIHQPRVCAEDIVPPLPFGSFAPADLQFEMPGYAAEWFVAPGTFNMPLEILITPNDDLLVLSVRSQKLYDLENDGTMSAVAENLGAYFGDIDSNGNIYLYGFPGGEIYHIAPDGTVDLVVQSPEIQTACDSGFGLGPDGNLYMAYNTCSDLGSIKRITLNGEIETLAIRVPWMTALRTTPDGRLLGAGYRLYEISMDDFSVTKLTPNPVGNVSPSGMAFDDAGNTYLATGSREQSGQIFKVDQSGKVSLWADVPDNGLSGIEWLADTQEIIGSQLVKGAVIAVREGGGLREIVPGNGLNSPMGMAFSPCGELAIANDDAEMMALINPAGEVGWFFSYISFTPPTPFAAFDPDGTLYVTEGAPGMPSRVSAIAPGGELFPLVEDVDIPCGIARRADGAFYVAETRQGRISLLHPNGELDVFIEELEYPQDLAIDADGNLFVIVGPAGFQGDGWFDTPNDGDRVIRITPEGGITTLTSISGVTALVIDPQGELYASAGPYINHISPNGRMATLASGLSFIRGLAFDLAGNLYASDADLNGIVRFSGFPQGTLSGFVIDEAGTPLEGARVQVLSVDPIVVGQVVFTDSEGRFSLPAAPRNYTVLVDVDDYVGNTVENVVVLDGQDTFVEISLNK